MPQSIAFSFILVPMRELALLGALVMTLTSVSAQDTLPFKKFYIEISGGYSFPFVNDNLGSTREIIGSANYLMRADSSISSTSVFGTQGSGWRTSFNVGYMVHKNVGFEFQVNYFQSQRFLLAKTESPTFKGEHTVKASRLELAPQLVLNFDIKKWSMYSKTGVILPVWGNSRSSIKIDDRDGYVFEEATGIAAPVHAKLEAEVSTFGKFSYGIQTRLGGAYRATNWLSVFAEMNFTALSINSKENIVNSLNIDFFDAEGNIFQSATIEDADVIDRHTVYVSELTETSNNPTVNPNPDPNRPMEELNTKNNFNTLGLSIGLRFYIR